MREQLQRHQGTATWAAAVMALAAVASEVVDVVKAKDDIQDKTSTKIMSTLGEKQAAYAEWKTRTVDDIKQLEASVLHCRESIAGLTATVDILTNRQGGKADRALEEVKTYISAPLPASADMVIDLESSELGAPLIVRGRPTSRHKSKKKRLKSTLKSDDKIEISKEQTQQKVYELFGD